jgi:outer membrane protein TolC
MGFKGDVLNALGARALVIMLVGATAGCSSGLWNDAAVPEAPPSVAPVRQVSSGTLRLTNSGTRPMFKDVLTVDLGTVTRIATLDNVGIQEARQRVEASHGQLEAAAAAVLPVVGPGAVLGHLQGVDINNLGVLQAAHLTTFSPAILVHWAVNPGQIFFDVVASKKRLLASGEQERSTVMQTVSTATLQYYDLVLGQARISVAREALKEAEELLSLASKRLDVGAGLPVDVTRAKAALAARQQDLLVAVNGFYKASIALGATLYLDPTLTLIPKAHALVTTTLVRSDLGIDKLLTLAAEWHPDLQAVRDLAAAASADVSAVIWGAGLPTLQAGHQVGTFGSWTPGKTFASKGQNIDTAGIGWVFNPQIFGQAKTAGASEEIAQLEVKRLVQQVGDQIVTAVQDSATNLQLIPIARQQLAAAEDALHITQENFQTGTGLFLDVLLAEDAVNQARLNYATAITNYNKSQVNLLAALGLIDQEKVTGELRPAAAQRAYQPHRSK